MYTIYIERNLLTDKILYSNPYISDDLSSTGNIMLFLIIILIIRIIYIRLIVAKCRRIGRYSLKYL